MTSKSNDNEVYPMTLQLNGSKKQIKWNGELEDLKSFVETKLNLSGKWSYTTNNGGFHILKSPSATLCFYPGARTLVVQGPNNERIKRHIEEFVSDSVQ